MERMKYVLNKDSEEFVFFPMFMDHSSIRGKWTSAGFINLCTNEKDECGNIIIKVQCFGKSISLNLESDSKNDEAIINSHSM